MYPTLFVIIYEHIWLVSNNFEHSKYKHSLFHFTHIIHTSKESKVLVYLHRFFIVVHL